MSNIENQHNTRTNEFQEGDWVYLTYKEKKWVLKIKSGLFHTHKGLLNLMDLVGKTTGATIKTNLGVMFKAYKPQLKELVQAFKQQSQIIYAKDIGAIIYYTGLKPGDLVLEAGTGSGALTAFLAQSVGVQGKIITHDNREHALNIAKKNHEKIGLTNIEYHLTDVVENGFQAQNADVAVLDMGTPWLAIPHLTNSLKKGGNLAVFIPTFNQIERTYQALTQNGFDLIKAIELLEREIQLKPGAIRPSTRMIGHTGYLIFANYSPTQ